MIRDLIIKNRSYRRFDSSVKITVEQVVKWIELARFSPSSRNMQPLKYMISTGEEINKKVCLYTVALSLKKLSLSLIFNL